MGMNGGFKILEHAMDLRIRVFGSSREELFKNALAGMASIQKKEIVDRKPTVKYPIFIESIDASAILVDFLSEVLALADTNQEVYFCVKLNEFSDTVIDAEIRGVKVNKFDEDIKAVTYHGVDIQQSESGLWEAEIVFDI